MARRLWILPLLFLLGSCGGPSLCDCQAESEKENPDVELMTECSQLLEDRDFEEVENELANCGGGSEE